MHVDLRSFLCFALCHLRITQKLGRSDALVLSTLFYACFEDKEQTEGIQKALRHVFVEDSPGRKGKDLHIFSKKFVFIPINKDRSHWVLVVVVNPGHIMNFYKKDNRKHPMPLMLHLDSLPEGKGEDGFRGEVHANLVEFLKHAWDLTNPTAKEEGEHSFTTDSLPLFSPLGE